MQCFRNAMPFAVVIAVAFLVVSDAHSLSKRDAEDVLDDVKDGAEDWGNEVKKTISQWFGSGGMCLNDDACTFVEECNTTISFDAAQCQLSTWFIVTVVVVLLVLVFGCLGSCICCLCCSLCRKS